MVAFMRNDSIRAIAMLFAQHLWNQLLTWMITTTRTRSIQAIVILFAWAIVLVDDLVPYNDGRRLSKMGWLMILKSWIKREFDRLCDAINSLKTTPRANLRRSTGMDRRMINPRSRMMIAALAMTAVTAMPVKLKEKHNLTTTFDTDSKVVGIDNRCTACISSDANDFIGDIRPSGRVIKGFGGTKTTGIMTGTIKWT